MLYLEKYSIHLKNIKRADTTIKGQFEILKKADEYFKSISIDDERNISEKHILLYLSYLKENKTYYFYYRSIIYLKSYFRFLEDEKIIFLSPLESIEIPKEQRTHYKVHSQKEIKEILNKIDTDDDFGIRVKAILELLYSTAMRPREASNLKTTDIDFAKKIIFIKMGKGNKDRIVPVGKNALYWLKKYINEVRPKYLKDKSITDLFISFLRTGKKIKYRSFYFIIHRAINRYNLLKIVPYSIRVSSATHLLENGMSILHIQKLLGHESVTTTKSYLRVDTLILKNKLDECHPRNHFKKLKEKK